MTKPQVAMAWVAALVVTHLWLRILRPDLGPEPGALMMAVFFGLNLPTMGLAGWIMGRQQPQKPPKGFGSPVFIGGMVAIVIAFMSAPIGFGPKLGLGGLLCVMTAQSLWLAWPVYWMARLKAAEDLLPPGPVGKA